MLLDCSARKPGSEVILGPVAAAFVIDFPRVSPELHSCIAG